MNSGIPKIVTNNGDQDIIDYTKFKFETMEERKLKNGKIINQVELSYLNEEIKILLPLSEMSVELKDERTFILINLNTSEQTMKFCKEIDKLNLEFISKCRKIKIEEKYNYNSMIKQKDENNVFVLPLLENARNRIYDKNKIKTDFNEIKSSNKAQCLIKCKGLFIDDIFINDGKKIYCLWELQSMMLE